MATLAATYNTRRASARAAAWDSFPDAARAAAAPAVAIAPAKQATGTIAIHRTLLATAEVLQRTISAGLLTAAGFFVLLFGTQFLPSPTWDGAWWVVQVRSIGEPIVVQCFIFIKAQWPTFRFAAFLPLVLALAVGAARVGANAALIPLTGGLRKRLAGLETQAAAAGAALSDEAEARVDSEQDRDELLKRYREIESALRDTGRKRCTFLSVDVVGSTRMKENENELPVTITFQAYMRMLEDVFERHSAWKQSWTPDGVMVCFLDSDAAVAAGQEVLRRLRVFNRTENLLRTRISVRCGVNEGFVPIFEDSKLEKIAHRVIDIAGHLQKSARPDTLWLAAAVRERLMDPTGFRPTGQQVDGVHAFEWTSSLAMPDTPPAYVAAASSRTEATWA